MNDRILRSDEGGLCTLTLNRPDKRWKPRMVDRLATLPQPVIAAVHRVWPSTGNIHGRNSWAPSGIGRANFPVI